MVIIKLRPISGYLFKFFFVLLFSFVVLSYNFKTAFATEDFSTRYFITYDLSSQQNTDVDFNIEIENLNNKSYVREYTLNIETSKITDIKAFNKNGTVPVIVEDSKGVTQIKSVFESGVVGKGSILSWHITYKDKEIGTKNGMVWNVNIPKFNTDPNLSSYLVKVVIPASFGPEIYSSPEPSKIEKNSHSKTYFFEGNRLKESGAVLSFGKYQLYNFNLSYHLKNPNILSAEAKIALPPTVRGEQEVVLNKIDPPPTRIEEDKDGNIYAFYKLLNRKEILVNVEGFAKIIHPFRNMADSGYISEIPDSVTKSYTNSQDYWETGDPQVVQIIKDLVDKKSKVSEIGKKLFDYTKENLKYDKNRISPSLTRYGSKKALQNKDNAVCMEFADVLTTLLRASGIPAQVLEGYAYTENDSLQPVVGDVLHSWVRFYDPRNGWVSVDPTWASTSHQDYYNRLDTNHLIFAIKGSSSILPYPAGAYKINPSETGDIDVKLLTEEKNIPSPQIELGLLQNSGILNSILGNNLKFVIKNTGSVEIFDALVSFDTLNQFSTSPKEIRLGNLPPYSNKEFQLTTSNAQGTQKETIKANLMFTNFDGEFKNLKWESKLLQLSSKKHVVTVIFAGILALIVLSAYFVSAKKKSHRKK